MSDELTVRVADVLAAHHDVRTAGFGRWSECSCSPRALLEAEFIAHQAERVRAVLGETTTEWGVLYEVSSTEEILFPASDEEAARSVVADSPTDHGLRARTVTPWTEVPS